MNIIGEGLNYSDAINIFSLYEDNAIAISEGSIFIYMTVSGYRTCSIADPIRYLGVLPEKDQINNTPWVAVQIPFSTDNTVLRDYFSNYFKHKGQ